MSDLIERIKSGTAFTTPDEIVKELEAQQAEIAQLKQELQLYLPPATISGDYGQGWVEGQAWMINCIRGEDAFDKAVPLTHSLIEKDAEIARLREALGVLEAAGSKMLEAVDRMNEKEGKFLCGGPIFQLAKAIGSARKALEQKL